MKFKKLLSVLLALVMVFSCVPVAFAVQKDEAYTPSYDTKTPVVILHGIGQNDTFALDKKTGERVTDKDGNYVTGWPLAIDIKGLLKDVLPSLLASIVTRRNVGLTESFKKGAYDLLYAIHRDNEGNYIDYDYEVPCERFPVSKMDPDLKDIYYRRIPIVNASKNLGENGEDLIYFFGYDSLGDVENTAKNLHDFIVNTVLPQTGASKVNICPISLGGSLAVEYLDLFPEDHAIIKKIVYVVPALDGSNIVGDILTGNMGVNTNEGLYFDLMTFLMGDTFTTHLINMLLRVLLPSKVFKEAFAGVAEGVVEAAVLGSTQLWALCPDEQYPEAREKWLNDGEHEVLLKKVDRFMKARKNFENNQNDLKAKGAELYDIVCYNLSMYPFAKDYKTSNSDGIIQAVSTSAGATFAPLGETLGENYKAKGTYCNNPSHNHLSPDGIVDPTTGLFPCTSWYFKGQAHESLAGNNIVLGLASELLTDDNMKDVYSNPAVYPQYNGARNVRQLNKSIEAYEKFDKSTLSKETVASCEKAITDAVKERDNTIINEAAYDAVCEKAFEALNDAGVMEYKKTSDFEKSFNAFSSNFNKCFNKVADKIDK